MIMTDDTFFMKIALEHAENALRAGEFPVGCVITDGSSVLATGSRIHSSRADENEVDHAEIIALKNLAEGPRPPDRNGLAIYCTLEPCLMCFGAIILSNINKIVYAFEDVMGGGTGVDRDRLAPLYKNARVSIVPGVLRKESHALFKSFFNNPSNTYWKDSLLARYILEL
jgi:tRNA(adenine34) deaminase